MTDLSDTTYNISKLEGIANAILKEAKRLGATEAEMSMAANKGFSISVHGGDVETVEYHQDKIVDITVYFDKRMGSASLSDLRPEAINKAVEAACHIAKFTDSDPAAGLADKQLLAFNYPELKLASPWHLTVEQGIELALECERQALAFDKRIMSAESIGVSTFDAWHIYANSHGFVGAFPHTRHEMSCILVAKSGEDMQRDYSYTVAVDPSQLESVSYLAKHAAERTIQRLGARTIKTMKVPVIYLAEEARGLLGHFIAAIQGGHLYRRSSFLLDSLGQQIFPTFLTLQENPQLAFAMGSAPFDNDGVATRPNVFVENGVLSSYALSAYSARKLGLATTGNAGGIHNLMVSTGIKNLTELLKDMNKGIVITELMGQGVNITTGDYSRGASGYWVEKGEIQYPVQGITVAGKLQDMFKRIVEIGDDIDTRGNIRTGSILIEEMMVAGN